MRTVSLAVLLLCSAVLSLNSADCYGAGLTKSGSLPIFDGADYIAIGDFNEDGNADIVAVSRFGQTLTVYLGKGDGRFQTGQTIKTRPDPLGLATADFNRDGHLDIAVADQGSTPTTYGNIKILLGNGDGTFDKPIEINHPVPFPSLIVTADVNEDGVCDLLVVDTSAVPVLAVLLGKGDGNFVAGTQYALNQFPFDPIAADFNQDGHVDIAIPTYQFGGPNVVALYFGNGDGTFGGPSFVNTGATSTEFTEGPATGDFNDDGIPDLVVCNSDQNNPDNSHVAELLGDGTGGFEQPLIFKAGVGCAYIAVGDLDGDGILDAVTTSGPVGTTPHAGISVLRGIAGGGFAAPTTYTLATGQEGTSVNKVRLTDLNNDGRPDVPVASINPDGVAIFLNTSP